MMGKKRRGFRLARPRAASADVGGLNVAVDDSLLVCVLDGPTDLHKQFQTLLDAQSLPVTMLGDGDAGNVLHDEVWPSSVGRAGVEVASDLRNIRSPSAESDRANEKRARCRLSLFTDAGCLPGWPQDTRPPPPTPRVSRPEPAVRCRLTAPGDSEAAWRCRPVLIERLSGVPPSRRRYRSGWVIDR